MPLYRYFDQGIHATTHPQLPLSKKHQLLTFYFNVKKDFSNIRFTEFHNIVIQFDSFIPKKTGRHFRPIGRGRKRAKFNCKLPSEFTKDNPPTLF